MHKQEHDCIAVLSTAGKCIHYLSARFEPFLDLCAREDLIIVDLVATPHHGMQGGLGMPLQHIPPQHKLHAN